MQEELDIVSIIKTIKKLEAGVSVLLKDGNERHYSKEGSDKDKLL